MQAEAAKENVWLASELPCRGNPKGRLAPHFAPVCRLPRLAAQQRVVAIPVPDGPGQPDRAGGGISLRHQSDTDSPPSQGHIQAWAWVRVLEALEYITPRPRTTAITGTRLSRTQLVRARAGIRRPRCARRPQRAAAPARPRQPHPKASRLRKLPQQHLGDRARPPP